MKQWHEAQEHIQGTCYTRCGRLLPIEVGQKSRNINQLEFENVCPICRKHVNRRNLQKTAKWFKES